MNHTNTSCVQHGPKCVIQYFVSPLNFCFFCRNESVKDHGLECISSMKWRNAHQIFNFSVCFSIDLFHLVWDCDFSSIDNFQINFKNLNFFLVCKCFRFIKVELKSVPSKSMSMLDYVCFHTACILFSFFCFFCDIFGISYVCSTVQ